MARRPFGGGPSDYVEAINSTGERVIVPSAVVTFWNAASDGTQYTDLLDSSGASASSITATIKGSIAGLQGPDGVAVMWADAGAGSRQQMLATDTPSRLSSLETANAAFPATFTPLLPAVGGVTYNADGTVATDNDGISYTYNPDGTVHTETKAGVTRTHSYAGGNWVGVA